MNFKVNIREFYLKPKIIKGFCDDIIILDKNLIKEKTKILKDYWDKIKNK